VSSGFEEILRERIREELESLGLSLADAARKMESGDYNGLRDVCNGRKRVTAEFLNQLGATGVDVNYILTGTRMMGELKPDEAALVDNYRHASPDRQATARAVIASFAELQKLKKEAI
jgi:transcriptional regulator with XRE-family HTH domain